jgi:hypothetical protein
MFEKPPKIEIQNPKPFNFEKWLGLELPKQYEENVKILNKLGILEVLPEAKDSGIVGIDGKEYPLPEMEEIKKEILKNKEMFETKMKQGFTDLNIVPFGVPLQKLIQIMEKCILKHHKEGTLFTAKKNIDDKNEPLQKLELNESEPLFKWDGYDNADTEGKIVYYPKEFSKDNHQGQTKKEILEKNKKGFFITLNEEKLNIPKKNQNEIIGGRKRLEANKSSNDYLKMLQNKEEYKNEQGQVPEEWIAKFLTTLEKHNQVIDNYEGNGKASFQLGAYFPFSGNVPGACWFRDSQRAGLYGDFPGRQSGADGARSSARVL